MAKAVSIKNEDLKARSYVDRLILEKIIQLQSVVKVSDIADKLEHKGIGLATVRALLASDSHRFAYHERNWVPAARLEGTDKTVAEKLKLHLERLGGPMSVDLFVHEFEYSDFHPNNQLENIIIRLAMNNPHFILTDKNEIILSSWTFQAAAEPLERALTINEVSQEDFNQCSKTLSEINWRDADAIQKALRKCAPISAKTLGAVAWAALTPPELSGILIFDWREFGSKLFASEGYIFGTDGLFYPETEASNWIQSSIKIAEHAIPTIEIEDIVPVEIKPEDLEKMIGKIQSADSTITSTRLLEEFYEITPAVKTFREDIANLNQALTHDHRVVWVGGDRFKVQGTIPELIHQIPEPFYYHSSELQNEEGELIDFEINEEGISTSLRKLLLHPLAMDVLDEEKMAAPKTIPEQLRLVLRPIHRELGTFPLCQIPTGWLDSDPEIQEFIFIDPTGRELQVWANLQTRLMFNLLDWWYEQPTESGAVFTLTKTSKKNIFEFQWMDQPDPVVYITNQRMEQLREIQSQSENKSTFEILKEVLSHWPKGADFLTLFWEVNVVRKSKRALIASLLSSYLCFYQRSGSPVWHYDAKKVELGVDKTKKKFILKS